MLCCMADHKGTTKSRRLGSKLREVRDERGLTLRQLAAAIEIDYSKISKIENGRTIPAEGDVIRILTHLGVTGDRYEKILGMLRGADAGQWDAVTLPDQREQLATLIDFEDLSAEITELALALVPGIMQTRDYARAIFSGGTLPADEVSTRVATRLGRRDVIMRRNPTKLVALIGEPALRWVIGSPDVMVGQLEFLLELADRPNVEIRAVSYDSGWSPLLEGACSIIDPREEDSISVVFLENRRSSLVLHAEEDVAAYRRGAAAVLQKAMSPADTTGLIADVIKGMRTG